jgi:hypothetical protein
MLWPNGLGVLLGRIQDRPSGFDCLVCVRSFVLTFRLLRTSDAGQRNLPLKKDTARQKKRLLTNSSCGIKKMSQGQREKKKTNEALAV